MKSKISLNRLVIGFIALFAIIFIGTLGYRIIEGWSVTDAIYMTVITLTTVGFQEVHELSPSGRVFTVFLILGGVGSVFYILTSLVQYFLEGEFGIRIGRRRMESEINKLKNHFIVCGFGRVGQEIATTLTENNARFVVIDKNEDTISKAHSLNYLAISDDATNDEVLKKAGIETAKGLIAALGNDADNTYVTLATRELNPSIPIIVRANNETAIKKLKLAGASHVIAPELIGGQQMARLAVRPKTVKFIETILLSKDEEVIVEEITVGDGSHFAKLTVKEIEEGFPRIKILAIRTEGGTITLDPHPATIVEEKSNLTVFGPFDVLQKMEGCCEYLPTDKISYK